MSHRLTTMMTSPPDREHLVVEIWNGDTQWGEVSRSSEGLLLETYAAGDGSQQLVALGEVRRVLAEAAEQLEEHEAEERGS